MSNLTTFKTAGLPAVQDLAASLKESLSKSVEVGVVIAKMDKTGHWVYGANQDEIEKDSLWAINPFSFVHGYVAWGVGKLLGEKMTSMTQPLPKVDDAPPEAPRGWELQIGFAMKCISGLDENLEARFTTASVGGKRAVAELGGKVSEHIISNPDTPVAIVKLQSSHYSHDSYGKIYVPSFEVVKWVSMDGDEDSDKSPELELEPKEETTTRRRRAV
jgi:hypothetical protein